MKTVETLSATFRPFQLVILHVPPVGNKSYNPHLGNGSHILMIDPTTSSTIGSFLGSTNLKQAGTIELKSKYISQQQKADTVFTLYL